MQPLPLIIGLGEILWDVFPGVMHFGGAPANFAFHARGLGAQAAVISAVGNDELGDRAVETLQSHGLIVSGVMRDDHPTGRVDVKIDAAGKPTYHFAPDCAWDHLRATEEALALINRAAVVCYGTLAQRSVESQRSVIEMLSRCGLGTLRVFDVNLRRDFYSAETIRRSMEVADVLKLNDEELPIVAAACDCSGDGIEGLRAIMRRFEIQTAALTLGSEGSVLLSGETVDHVSPVRVAVRDTVGAGDAFTAALVIGLLLKQPLSEIHRRAAETAAYVCTQAGATPTLPTELKMITA